MNSTTPVSSCRFGFIPPFRFRDVMIAAAFATVFMVESAQAQQSVGAILGRIREPIERGESMRILLREVSSGTTVIEAHPGQDGSFALRDVPFAHYRLDVLLGTVVVAERWVTVSSSIPVTVEIDSLRRYAAPGLTVEAPRAGVEREKMGSSTFYTATTIRSLPTPTPEKGIEAMLLNTPGVVPDEDGRLHVRGEDAQLQYVIDGIPVTGNMTRVYSSLFSSGIIKSVDIQTGGLAAEYGRATAGVLAVTTKSGFDRPVFATGRASMGSFGNRDFGLELGGSVNDRVAVYLAGATSRSDRYLDPIAEGDPLHDYGESQHYFGKVNAVLGGGIDLNLLGGYNKTTYYVPNGKVGSAQDQRQNLDDYLAGVRVNAELTPSSFLSVLGYTRHAHALVTSGGLRQISSSADSAKAVAENEKLFIGADRVNDATGGQIEFSARTDWFSAPNAAKIGVGGEVYPLKEFFTFAVTNPALSNPDSSGGDRRYQPYDLTKGGRPFLVDREQKGKSYFAYAQDQITFDRWTISAGLRFDMFDLIEQESGISPRLGATYAVNDNLILRGSYNRIVMQAPVENILVSSSLEAKQLTGAEQGTTPTTVRSEKSHNIELGAAYRLNDYLTFDLAAYGKLIDDFIVKVELGNSGIIFPVNLRNGLVAGGDLRVELRDWNNFSGFLSVGSGVALGLKPDDTTLSPIAAGLILGEEGQNYSHPFAGEDIFPTEHNQILTSSMNLTYHLPMGFFATLGGRFDMGLPFDLTDKQGVGLDPAASRAELHRRGYSDAVIDLLSLASEKPGSPDKSVAPHVTFDVAAGIDLLELTGVRARISATVINVLDTPYLYKFESSFGGTHFGQPRIFSLQIEAGL
ncbi:MAG: TonB-dependent receptor [Candidatus Kapaibacterium sp.]